MAKVKEQFMVGINLVKEMTWDKARRLVFDEHNYDDTNRKSTKVAVSECRIFRMECHTWEDKVKVMRDEYGRLVRDENGLSELEWTPIRSAREFVVVDFKKCKSAMMIKKALRDGFVMKYADGSELLFKRVCRSAAKARTGKALFTCKDPNEVRERCSFGAQFDEYEVISKMEARFGLPESSSTEIKVVPTIDVMPDYVITRKHDVEVYTPETEELTLIPDFEKEYTPLDGQGTILPRYAATVAHELELIGREDMKYLQRQLKKQRDPRYLVNRLPKFARIWSKVPSAYLIRFGFAKGLLIVHPHNLETQDCEGNTIRTEGKVMKFWREDEHAYNFDADIMFTDSMWKANFNKDYLTGVDTVDHEGNPMKQFVHLEVVRHTKQPKGLMNMGYQYWQALNPEIVNPQTYAKIRIDEIKETILVNADHAKAFLGNIDMSLDADTYEESMTKAGGRIQKILEILNENPDMLQDPYIQKSLRDMRHSYISQMAGGRIPVRGANPFIITAPELQFGRESELEAGQHYYNGTDSLYAAFRSPLIHRSEAILASTVPVSAYDGLYKNLLVFNPFDDSLPRMGGADTDGDTVALTDEEGIVNAVYSRFPMLYDEGKSGEKQLVCAQSIYEFDYATISSDAPTIGEVTNMSTSWKDIAQNPKIMRAMGLNEDDIDYIVKILRFMQGWAIDYAKTGYFPNVPDIVNIETSPHWQAWSRRSYEAGIEQAKPFESTSRLGRLYDKVTDYVATKFYKPSQESTTARDFTFEFAAAADLNVLEDIKPQVALMERAYRNELDRVHDSELDEDQAGDMIKMIIDKYQRAVLSLDADIATIAAAAYQYSYYENGTKGKSISFPWVVCYEGMLMNASASNDEKTKLRVSRYTGHIDDIPQTLTFYRCESKDVDYSVKCRVPNGTFETFRKNGNLYIKTKVRANSRIKNTEKTRPVDLTLPFDMVGFKANGFSPEEVIAALKAENGMITIKQHKDNDNGEVRAAVFIGDQRMGSVAKQYKGLIAPHVPCALRVTNVDMLAPTFVPAKSSIAKAVAFFAFDAMLVEHLNPADLVMTESGSTNNYDGYPNYDDAYIPTEAPIEMEPVEFEESPVFEFRADIMKYIDSAPYFQSEIDTQAINIIGVAVKQTGAIKQGEVCADVVLTNTRGQKKVVAINVIPGKQFGIVDRKGLPEDVQTYILQIAHHELYRMHIERQAN